MRRISYSDEHFVTTNGISEKLLEYAKLMGRRDTDDVVQIPAFDDSGAVWSVEVLIGPASQITAVQTKGDELDFDDSEVVAELEKRIAALGPSLPMPARAAEDGEAITSDFDPDFSDV
ncbi:MAG: hypothetical protein JWR33_2222 [Naasia sp.]|uniref:hypothetical protein n=1 Tax=Naasia sp. TaxID=2546198 RepID=UPI002629A218|nr:hypothetical protein [Naasia sp.]MCU1571481.1 hypothetical protein [Naasia sp.]